MRSTWWVFVGAGAAFSASLGACSGYSSLGEVPGGGGETGTEETGGSMSMGATGGQGRGGTNGMGASSGMVGGSNGMGAVGGTGMGAVAGTEMGMGAVGGGSDPLSCMTDADCPPPPPSCTMCPDGTSACLSISCVNSVCALDQPVCPSGPEPVRCMTDEECPTPSCEARADGQPCAVAVCSMGYCGVTLPTPEQCMTVMDCPSPSCDMRPDGTLVCPVAVCTMGYCGQTLPAPEGACQGQRCGDTCMRPDGTSGTCNATRECVDAEPDCSVLDFSAILCDASFDSPATKDPASVDFLVDTCAHNGCHGENYSVGLDMRPDSGFARRLLDAPATHGGICCVTNDCATNCVPDSCPAPGTAKLIDSANPMASWILTTTRNHDGCGSIMPDAYGLSDIESACLTAIVNATAALSP